MKVIIGFLFVLQLMIGGIWILNNLSAHHHNQLLHPTSTEILIDFEGDLERYAAFLAFLSTQDIEVTHQIHMGRDQITLYSTDPTFGGMITLREGDFPTERRQFISNVAHSSENQVGLMPNFWPQITINIRYLPQPEGTLDYPQSFDIDGFYLIHTVDSTRINDIDLFLSEHAAEHEIIRQQVHDVRFSDWLMMGANLAPTETARNLMMLIPIMSLICLTFSLIQFGMNQMKKGFILLVHGYDKREILIKSLIEVLTIFLVAGLSGYSMLMVYLVVGNFSAFFLGITGYFLLLFIILVVLYLGITAIVMSVILNAFRSPKTIKGFKPDGLIQYFNHLLKSVFTLTFLLTGYFLTYHINELQLQLDTISHWDVAEGVYRVPIINFPHVLEVEEEQSGRTVQFHHWLAEKHHGFVMDSSWIASYDEGTPLVEYAFETAPSYVLPFNNRVDIDFNYLLLNPIETVSGQPIEALVDWDESVLNLLVPQHFAAYEDTIRTRYVGYFYNFHVDFINRYRERMGYTGSPRTEDDLSVNIIYVESDQYYFSFNPMVRSDDGNRIKDPIAVFYTGSWWSINTQVMFQNALFFITDSAEPYSVIESQVEAYELERSIVFVYSAFDHFGEMLTRIIGDITRSVLFMIGLFFINVIVSYHLIANYFWRYKSVLFMKKLFGFSLLKRHKWFIISFLGYLIPIIGISSLILGLHVLMIGFSALAIELLIMCLFEERLMKKSFAKMMKGER